MRRLSLSAGLVSVCLLAACGQAAAPELEVPSETKLLIGQGSSQVLTVSSDVPVYIGFGFETGSGSFEAAHNCPEQNVSPAGQAPFIMRLCGEVRDAQPVGSYATHFQGQHGGGTMFQPVDGVVKVNLTNFAPHSMEYVVTVSETLG